MGRLIKKFSNYSEYEAAQNSFILPNVYLCEEENEVYYNPYIDTRIVAKFKPESTEYSIRLCKNTSDFSKIE